MFQIRLADGVEGEAWKSKSGHFRLIHVPTKVAMWTHPKQLPDWAYKQQEINGNKNVNDKTAIWFVDTIIADESKYLLNLAVPGHIFDSIRLHRWRGHERAHR